MKVLVVCLGNICRSPTGEAVLRAQAPEWEVDSAGTGSWHLGSPPYAPMMAAAPTYAMSGLRARQVEPADFTRFDLILGMDEENLSDLEAIRPANATATLALFDATGAVPDPYYTRDFDCALKQIETAATALVTGRAADLVRGRR